MDGVNRCTCLGRLGADPELRFTQGGKAVMELRVACTESWFDRGSNQRKEHTEWVTCTLWGARAEGLAKVVRKGDLLYLEGPLRTTSYEDRDGNKRWKTVVEVRDVKLCGGGKGGGGQRGRAAANEEPNGGGYGGGYGQGDDDIPF